MQVASDERKNIIMDDADIPAGLDRLDLILEADAKRSTERNVIAEIKERLNNIDAMIAYILNTLDDDLDYEDPDAGADDDPLWIDEPFGPPDDPYADIEIPPPDGREPDLDADLPALPPGLIDNREYWRTVDGFPNYEVSHHGNVRNATTGRILKPSPDKDGYLKVCLRCDGLQKKRFIHRLVAKAWLPNPEDKPQVDHIDGNKRNNMLNNLRWATPAENLQNRGPNRLNTTGYKGVDIHKGRYRARIRIPGRRLHLGIFDTAEEAGAAYDAAALIHHGAYAHQGLRP